MRVAVVTPYGAEKIISAMKGLEIEEVKKNPEFVIAYGGDGTILKAERLYPTIPKIPFKKSSICNKCTMYRLSELERVLEAVKKGDYHVREFAKVEGRAKGKRLVGLNEMQVHNADPRKALRFDIKAGGRTIEGVIGDGIVAATPYGSTGYYKAIGYEPFDVNIRLGFNNATPRLGYIELRRGEKAEVVVRREKGILLADNSKETANLKPGDEVVVSESKEKARFVEVKS